MKRVRIAVGGVEMLAALNDTETARSLADALPISSRARVWGDEVYFETELSLPEERPVANVPPGTVAYWPPGRAICLFFGQRPASPVNVIGRMLGNPRDLAAVRPGQPVAVEAAGEAEPPPVQGPAPDDESEDRGCESDE